MPHHCCVPGCVSNSKAAQCADVSFHSFPTDPSRRRAWIGRVRRDVGPHFSLNSHTKVCSRHFQEHDFYPGDRRRSGVICHERRKLKPDAVPSTFPFQVESRKRKPPAERLPLPKKSKTKEKKPEVCQGDVDGDSETGKNEDKGPRLPERTPDLFGTSAADEDGPKQDDTSQNIFIDPIVSARKKAEKRDRHEKREKERKRRFGVNAIISLPPSLTALRTTTVLASAH